MLGHPGRATRLFQNLFERRIVFGHDQILCRIPAQRQPLIFCIAEKLHKGEHRPVSETLHKGQVGRRLRATIEALGVTPAAVAKAFDVSPSKLGNWLRGDNYPSEWFVKRFCDRYGVTMDWLYRGMVSGIDKGLADTLWASEEAQDVAAPKIAAERRAAVAPPRPKGRGPPRPTQGGRVDENRARPGCATNVRPLRVPA